MAVAGLFAVDAAFFRAAFGRSAAAEQLEVRAHAVDVAFGQHDIDGVHGEAADEQPLHGGIGADKGGHSQAAHLTKHEPSHEAGDGQPPSGGCELKQGTAI